MTYYLCVCFLSSEHLDSCDRSGDCDWSTDARTYSGVMLQDQRPRTALFQDFQNHRSTNEVGGGAGLVL